jgi:hypothetical protein
MITWSGVTVSGGVVLGIAGIRAGRAFGNAPCVPPVPVEHGGCEGVEPKGLT